jgi:hypothetical protein
MDDATEGARSCNGNEKYVFLLDTLNGRDLLGGW